MTSSYGGGGAFADVPRRTWTWTRRPIAYDNVDISIAVAMTGLVTPVLRDVGAQAALQCARGPATSPACPDRGSAAGDRGRRALGVELGMYGTLEFSAIITAAVRILAVGATRTQPVVVTGRVRGE